MELFETYAQDGTYAHPYAVNAANILSLSVSDERLPGSWIECNTDTLIELMRAGHSLRLPHVDKEMMSRWGVYDDEAILQFDDDVLDVDDIESIEYVGEMEVQCIEVADSDHMYLTDGLIPTHNTSNIIFLKSTDDTMLDTLQKMSGTKHVSYIDSKTVTKDVQRIAFQNDSKTSYTMSTREAPVVSYNDMAFLAERNSIVFRAGDSPIWNTNQTILPMSWRLFSFTIKHPGHTYSLQTIPTLSSARDFDVRKNQPNFEEMLEKRIRQSMAVDSAREAYKRAYGYESDYDIERLDPDNYADDIMEIVNTKINEQIARDNGAKNDTEVAMAADSMDPNKIPMVSEDSIVKDAVRNVEQERATQDAMNKDKVRAQKRFAGGTISPDDLVSAGGLVTRSYDKEICESYAATIDAFKHDTLFVVRGYSLYDRTGQIPYIIAEAGNDKARATISQLNEAAREEDSRVYAETEISVSDLNALGTYTVTEDFYRFLSSCPKWDGIANGKFEAEMARRMKA